MKRIAIALICLVLVACAPSAPPATATPTATATFTPRPIPTPIPTRTKLPTYTPSPAPTLPPRAHFEGTGDNIVELPIGAVGVLRIIGNAGSDYFGVEAFDRNNNEVDLLVNTTDPYDGRVPLNLFGDEIVRLQITASGPWTVEYIPINDYEHTYTKFQPLTGDGDDVWIFKPPLKVDTIKIVGNNSSGYFSVKLYGMKGSDLAVNTTDPYNGIYLYSTSLGNLILIVITAEDTWNIFIN